MVGSDFLAGSARLWGVTMRRRGPRAILALVIAAPLLAACSTRELTDTLGLTRDAPNEFMVTTRAPLQMPPSFEIRPPSPGTPRPQERPESRQAEEALVPYTALAGTTTQASPGQEAIVRAAGPPAPPNIRARVNAEASKEQPEQTLTDQLLFWRKSPAPGTVVDPTREAQRLRANAALGKSPEQGDTPIVQPKRRSMLGQIF